MSFSDAFRKVVGLEGKYSNDPNDPGGETMWGITKRVAVANGYTDEMSKMPVSVAQVIYQKQYWDINRLDDVDALDPGIAYEMFECGVNVGVAFAARFLQRSLNVLNREHKDYADIVVDGVMGSISVMALKGYFSHRPQGARVLLTMLNALQGAYYVALCEQKESMEEYIYGWFQNRVVI